MKRTVALIASIGSLAAPAAATAATVGAERDGRLVFRAAVGEVNDLTVRRDLGAVTPWQRTLLFDDASALLAPRLGCLPGDPVACEQRAQVVAHLGDRDDRADQRVGASSDSHVAGQGGNDEIFSSGAVAAADGGGGADRIQLSAAADALGYGGAGVDVLSAQASSFAVLHGGGGADVISATAMNVRLYGGDGPDAITGTASVGGAGGIVDAGPGADRIAAGGGAAPWRIACGPGRDTVLARPEDIVAADCEVVRRTGATARPGRPTATR